jgi:hypothetical protein
LAANHVYFLTHWHAGKKSPMQTIIGVSSQVGRTESSIVHQSQRNCC